MNNLGGSGIGLWNEEDEFYYDVLHTPGGRFLPLKVRSLVGLMPLLAVETIQWQLIDALPDSRRASNGICSIGPSSQFGFRAGRNRVHGRTPARRRSPAVIA